MTQENKSEHQCKRSEHFANRVPGPVREKIRELADKIEDDFISDLNGEPIGASRVSEIYGKPQPGFIPFQDGGYEITELYHTSGVDTSFALSEAHEEWLDESHDNMIESFRADFELGEEFDLSEASLELEEDFTEYENEWFDPALARVRVFVDRHPTQNVYIDAALNYSDAPYYREKRDDEVFFKKSIDFETFLNDTDLEALVKEMKHEYEGV